MTTIAWDGKTLAADSRSTLNNEIMQVSSPKIFHIPGVGVVSGAGGVDDIELFMDWIAAGQDPENKPTLSREADNAFQGIFWDENSGELYTYFGTLVACPELPPRTWGTGGPFASVALSLGQTAREAVKTACKFDIYSGGKVQFVTLATKRKTRRRK